MAKAGERYGEPPDDRWSIADNRALYKLMQSEGYDLDKFELVAVPEEFSESSGTDRLSHGGLLEYDGILEGDDSDSDSDQSNAEEFNVTIEHVPQGGNAGIRLLDADDYIGSTHPHDQDILEIGIEAGDLNSLLEQFEESENHGGPIEAKLTFPTQSSDKILSKRQEEPKPHPDPTEVVKKIAPVKRKSVILLESDALPAKRSKAKPTQQNADSSKSSSVALTPNNVASPIKFDLKSLIPVPKYLSMEHDYCFRPSPASSDKSNASDLASRMSKEERRAYYKNKYRVKKKGGLIASPVSISPASGSPASMSPMNGSPNHADLGNDEAAGDAGSKAQPPAGISTHPEQMQLFDKIPNYFSKKLLVGMYREINGTEEPTVHQGYDQSIFVGNDDNSHAKHKDTHSVCPDERFRSRKRIKRQHRKSRNRHNSLSTESDSSYCSSCSSDSQASENSAGRRSRSRRFHRRQRTRDQSRSSVSRSRSRSRSYSRSPSRSSYSSHSSRSRSRTRSRARHRSYSRSRSRSVSRIPGYRQSRSRSYSRSRSRSMSRSRSRSLSRSRSRSRSRTRNLRSRSRLHSRSTSRSPTRHRRSRSHRRRSRSRRHSRSKSKSVLHKSSRGPDQRKHSRSGSRLRSSSTQRSNEVIYTEKQLKEFQERRVIYVGNIDPDTTKRELFEHFCKFGAIDGIKLYFREEQDSYAFVTYRYRCDACAVIAAGNDPSGPQYDLCFGGRRKFCKTSYEDLDSMAKANEEMDFGYGEGEKGEETKDVPVKKDETDFDKLLKAAMKSTSCK